MSQQFTIQSEEIRDKLNTLLPSQNLGSIGVELTGSTQIIPIVDLTEVAEGSNLRQDLQTAISLGSATVFNVVNTTSTLINTTGFYRVFGMSYLNAGGNNSMQLTDGTTTKEIFISVSTTSPSERRTFDFNVFLPAGVSLTATSTSGSNGLRGTTRQIADLSGNLINP